VKSKIAALAVPEFTTDADVPGAPVVVDPTVTVAPGPVAPVSPCGIAKSRIAALAEPTLVTDAESPGVRVVVAPTLTDAA
jgi:hypothetical protein